jgi:hypothetical protein
MLKVPADEAFTQNDTVMDFAEAVPHAKSGVR